MNEPNLPESPPNSQSRQQTMDQSVVHATKRGVWHFLFGSGKRMASSIVVSCVVLGLVGFCLTKLITSHPDKSAGKPLSVMSIASCGTTKQLLKQSPINLDQLS